MRLRFRLCLASLPLLIGCGGAAPAPGTPAPAPASSNLAGNWQMQVSTVTPAPLPAFQLLGSLSVQGSSVSGAFRIPSSGLNTPCVSPTQNITFTGAVDSSNLLTLTSATFSGSTATLQLQLPLSASNIARGTARVDGGACAFASSNLLGILVPPVTGTYTGTLVPPQYLGQPATNSGGPATVVLTQSGANADGQFPLTANLTFTSPTCTLSADLTGTITGLHITTTSGAGSPFGIPAISLSGIAPANGSPLLFPILEVLRPLGASPTPAACASGVYTGQLTRK